MSRPIKTILWSGIGLFAILAIGVAVLLTFDWNRAKPWISSHVSEATGRTFAIDGDLSLSWRAPDYAQHGWYSWIPWPRLNAQDVRFGNPEWAKTSPDMAEAAQVTFSINPIALLAKRIVIPSLALESPQVTLERRKDGSNNWTLPSGGESQWEFELQRLTLNKGTVHLVDAVKRADIKAKINTLAEPSDNYRLRWTLEGSFNGDPVSGSGRAGAVLALRGDTRPYPLDAAIRVGATKIEAKGTLTQPQNITALDLRLKISGASMAQLYPITGVVLPDTRPFFTEGRLIGTPNAAGGNWTYENFKGKMGSSDLAGTIHYRARQPRPLVEGKVSSELLDFRDLSPLIGADSPESKARRGVKNTQPENKVLPVEEFRTERWTSIDTDVQFTGRRIMREKELPIDNLLTRVNLNDGVLSLAPLKFGMAGGNLVSNIRLDGRSKPMKAELKLTARHLKLKQLFPTFDLMQASLGEINGDASLTASGNSIAALLGSSDGEFTALINQGTMSKLFLEAIGLNIGSIVVTQLFGDKQVQLNCAVADFTVGKGIMHARTFVIDTDDAVIVVNGNIDLNREQLALRIRPESKGVRVISLRSPLNVDGSFKDPNVGVDPGVLALKAGSAIALGVLAPVATALLPLVNVGPGEKSECATLLAQANSKTASGK